MRFITATCITLLISCSASAKDIVEYFPDHLFNDYPDQNNFVADWYSKQLLAMHEQPLFPPQSNIQVYRFTWLRTFHNPMSFRLVINSDGSASLFVKRANGAGGYDPGQLDLDKTLPISSADTSKLLSDLVRMEFWNMPSYVEAGRGFDGSHWIVEGVSNGLYHVVDRWSPNSGLFHDWAVGLIGLSGENVGDIY